MQKTQWPSTLLRRRYRYLHISEVERPLVIARPFHHSITNPAEQDTSGMFTLPSNLLPPSRRYQDTVSEIKHVFDHGSRFYDTSQRKGGEPIEEGKLSGEVKNTGQQQISPRNNGQVAKPSPIRSRAIDARSLGAKTSHASRLQPEQRRPPAFEGAIDARSLGAAPGGPIDARNLAAQRPPTSPASLEHSPPSVSRRVLHDDQSNRPIIPRSINRNVRGPPRRDPGQRSGVDAASRKPPSGPASRKKSKGGGASRDVASYGEDANASPQDLDPTVYEYLEEVRDKRRQKPVNYKPAEVSLESLRGNGPAVPLGDWGMGEVVEEWVGRIARKGEQRDVALALMAEKWNNGEHVSFTDGDTKQRLLDVVENGARDLSEEEQAAVTARLKDTFGKVLGRKMVKGEYAFEGRTGQGVLDTLARQTAKNRSFFPTDGESFAAKVKSLLPPENSGAAQKEAMV